MSLRAGSFPQLFPEIAGANEKIISELSKIEDPLALVFCTVYLKRPIEGLVVADGSLWSLHAMYLLGPEAEHRVWTTKRFPKGTTSDQVANVTEVVQGVLRLHNVKDVKIRHIHLPVQLAI